MLPGPTPNTREPIKRDFNDLDSLLKELSVPKEQIQRNPLPQPGAAPSEPGQPATYIDDPSGDPIEKETLSPEVAALSGKMIANTIDTAAGTGFCLYAKNTTPEKYQATPKQLENSERAWAAVAAKYNYRVEDSPVFNALIQTVAIYFPRFQEAKNDRRFAEMDERFKTMQKMNDEMEARLKTLEKQTENAEKK